ncbi:TetR family transcriptional regulator [Agromyces sp. SYSU K20354]|uniref:TetR/AcrR family transcriptional regulator n=1 Tax=Agromyces cavernae TaxID=2898659 RepID=UPI001E30AC7E|nr:TetR family transcriptional regulator [Agromyces cavernae]MCD2440962.1 TetR family transcriptional regulator [Agromyces cavernae]
MAATRERALEAAVELLGTEGIRALSHARVDARAGLPAGSTSNWFRTRRSLLAGIVEWIAVSERAELDPALMPMPTDAEALIVGLTALLEMQTGLHAARTRARYALFLELADDPELGELHRRQRREFERLAEQLVTAAGVPEPVPSARALMALSDGLVFHRLTIDPMLDLRPPIERAVRALVQ